MNEKSFFEWSDIFLKGRNIITKGEYIFYGMGEVFYSL
jgi:hypothetical protein